MSMQLKINKVQARLLNFYLSMWKTLVAFAEKRPIMGTMAFITLGPVMGIIGTVILVIIVVLVLAALAPEFFQAVADITGALLSADLNSTLANTIAAIVAILVPLVLLFGFVGLVFAAANSFRRRGGY